MRRRRKRAFRLIAKALGEKANPESNAESDAVAMLRMAIFVSYFVTNAFIIAGVLRHWN